MVTCEISKFSTIQDRVYYVSESVMKASTSINKDNLLHCGTCLGKFTKSGKFRLHITALDYLAQYSKVSCSYTWTGMTVVVSFVSHLLMRNFVTTSPN